MALVLVGTPQAIAAPHCNPGKYAAWCAGASYDHPYTPPGDTRPEQQGSGSDPAGDPYLLSTAKSKASASTTAHANTSAAQQSSPANGMNGMSGHELLEHEVRSRFGN